MRSKDKKSFVDHLMRSNGKESLYFLAWGLGLSGIGLIFVFIVGIIKFIMRGEPIPWTRGLLVLFIGISLYLFARRYIKNR